MSDRDDSSSDNRSDDFDPAGLYRLYRASRQSPSETTDHQSTQKTETTFVEDNDMSTNTTADIVYRSYRESRTADHSQAIDAILQEINLEHSRDKLLLKLEQETPVQSGMGIGNTLGKVFTLPGRLLSVVTGQSGDAANDENKSVFRGAIPLAAAAMLALFVVPFLVINTQEEGGTSLDQLASVSQVPNSLLQMSGEAVNFVDPISGGAVGFSAELSPSGEFMNLGAAVTDLVVAHAAQSDEYRLQTKAGLERILANDLVGSVSSEISRLIEEVNSPAEQHNQLALAVGALSESIERQHAEDGLSDWYSLGQSLEALNLSAGLIIEGQDGVPLQEALKNHKALFPQEAQFGDDPRVNSLLQEIRMVSDDETDLLNSARQVNVAIDKINLLMD